jgi:hypothetical protein
VLSEFRIDAIIQIYSLPAHLEYNLNEPAVPSDVWSDIRFVLLEDLSARIVHWAYLDSSRGLEQIIELALLRLQVAIATNVLL